MPDSSSLRVADADREQLVGELREHHLAGRLSSEEFEQRVEAAYGASTRAQLDQLREDLPMSPATLEAELARRRERLRRRLLQEAGSGLGLSALCVGLWLADGASGSFWPIWVILVTMLPVMRNAWRLIGPSPDLDTVEARLNASRARRTAREQRQVHRHRHRGLPR